MHKRGTARSYIEHAILFSLSSTVELDFGSLTSSVKEVSTDSIKTLEGYNFLPKQPPSTSRCCCACGTIMDRSCIFVEGCGLCRVPMWPSLFSVCATQLLSGLHYWPKLYFPTVHNLCVFLSLHACNLELKSFRKGRRQILVCSSRKCRKEFAALSAYTPLYGTSITWQYEACVIS